jgi:hypothetical protein
MTHNMSKGRSRQHQRVKCPNCGDECWIPGNPCLNCELTDQIAVAYLTGRLLVGHRGESTLDAWRTRIYHLIRQRGVSSRTSNRTT